MQIEVIQCNTEVAMETLGKHQMKTKWLTVSLLCQTKTVEKLEENAKNKNMLKATQTWLNVWVTERKVNLKTEEFKHEQLEEESATE